MNKYRIENPNSNNELDYKSSSTLRTNPARRNVMQGRDRWNSPDKASYLKGNAQVGWFKSFPNGADRPDRYQKSPKSY